MPMGSAHTNSLQLFVVHQSTLAENLQQNLRSEYHIVRILFYLSSNFYLFHDFPSLIMAL